MAEMQEKPDTEVKETNDILGDYKQRIYEVIEKESEELWGLAEQKSRDIVAKARLEILDMRKKADEEAAKIVNEAVLKAEQITKDAEKQKESAIDESKKEAERITTSAHKDAREVITEAKNKLEQAIKARTS